MSTFRLPTKLKSLLAIAPVIIILDQITKNQILDRFVLHEMLSVIPGFFDLTYIQNTGAAFGMLQEADPLFRVPFFLLVPVLALGLIGYFFKMLPDKSLLVASAFSLIAGGAIGNVIDRIRFGYVIDFLYFSWKHTYFFPAFNVADAAISVGVAIIFLDSIFWKTTEPQNVKAR